MEGETKVFSSSIIRTKNCLNNNLYDILCIDSALPIEDNQLKPVKANDCNFIPKNDKYYVSKKKNGSKVKTVREIRALFESDVYSYLSDDLEKQKNLLLRKIRHGSSRDAKTTEIAKNMLKSCNPISRTAWQMLMNINPDGHKFSSQYVLWNGMHIQINGSKGGSNKFIYKYDICKSKEKILHKVINKKSYFTRKKGLLQNSLNVKFKPGPLTKKKNLDTSYQKHQFGEMKVVTLPKPALTISPSYGKHLAPSINSFLQNAFVPKANGIISSEWADFALSMLGVNNNGTAVQMNENCDVTFNLDYKCSQNRILMRNDSDIINRERNANTAISNVQEEDELMMQSEVNTVMNKLIDSVEISLIQNEIYFGEDEPRVENLHEKPITVNSYVKDKGKRKLGGELSRLDVTVIRIPESSESVSKNICSNMFCTLGCICESLKSSYNLKTHCGRIDCMFQCKCDFSKYKLSDSFGNNSADIICGLVNLDKKLGQTLAKEEHKFHQTVVVTDEKSILLNSRKRNLKTSTKYAEYYRDMPFKSKRYLKKQLSVSCTNLKIENVEPWCMVHHLYKCFCKGKFTETTLSTDKNLVTLNKTTEKSSKPSESKGIPDESISIVQESISLSSDENETSYCYTNYNQGARTLPYKGRKYNDGYYRSTNEKILEMERNDKSLSNRLMTLINEEYSLLRKSSSPDICSNESLVTDVETISVDNQIKQMSSQKLVTWLETNYKKYRAQTNYGLKQPSLHPPRPGDMALYPWDFILSRYREKKNHFLISKQQPYRIFMAVDHKNNLFAECININDIALSDLDKYPVTVKNLLTNATDLKDNFCILCGMLQCWELVGSVTKVTNDKNVSKSENKHDNNINIDDNSQRCSISKVNKDRISSDSACANTINIDENSQNSSAAEFESNSIYFDSSCDSVHKTPRKVMKISNEYSRWFVMTIEKDFTEIQFYTRGFFVKYESIMKAINVAKMSGKTVKLSSQSSSHRLNTPTFGIYAVPIENDNYVFIGPYEKDESLGIETIKSNFDLRGTKRTRGTWITTNKIDNGKVIDNPLLFMPSRHKTNADNNISSSKNLDISNHEMDDQDNHNKNINASPQQGVKEIRTKVVKPITIRKTNGFYQLAPNGLLKQVPINQKVTLKNSPSLFLNNSVLVNKSITGQKSPFQKYTSILSQDKEKRVLTPSPKQEITLKTDSETGDCTSGEVNKKRGTMFILKPEEINQRSLQNLQQHCSKDDMETDIENFLNSFVVCASNNDECYVISDDDDNTSTNSENNSVLKMVWIVCKNVESFGWISGMKNADNHLSFEFPGFKMSNFYKEHEAFEKINQVLSRKLYIPKHLKPEWEALETTPHESIKKLTVKDLSSEYVLTKKGLRHKSELLRKFKLQKSIKSSEDEGNDNSSTIEDILEEKTSIINDLEETSNTLEEENLLLLDELSKNNKVIPSLSEASEELREDLTEQLNNIKNDAKESE